MGRRTNEQICNDLRKERGNIYSKRSRLIKKPSNPKNDKKLAALNKRLDAIKIQIFRCGNKYSKLRSEKSKLKRHNQYLKGKVKKLSDDYSNKKITKKDLNKEKRKAYQQQRETISKIKDVENAMRLPVPSYNVSVGMQSLGAGTFAGTGVVWRLRDMVRDWLASGMFEYIIIDGELLDTDNPLLIWVKVDEAELDAMAFQDITSVSMFYYYVDPVNHYLEIKVREFNSLVLSAS